MPHGMGRDMHARGALQAGEHDPMTPTGFEPVLQA